MGDKDIAGFLLAAATAFAAPAPAPSPGFAPGASRPTAVALVVDASFSLNEGELARAREIGSALLGHLPAGSEAAVFTFDDEARLVQGFTSDPAAVARALSGVRRTGRFTALQDALYDASRALRDSTAPRRAIVLFTDGQDENSTLTLEDGVRLAQDAHIPIFTIGLGKVQERGLRRISRLTGGAYVPAARAGAPVLAERLAGATSDPAAAASRRRTAASPVPPAVAARHATTAWPIWAAALVVLAGMGVVAWRVGRRRTRPRCLACGCDLPDALAPCLACLPEDAERTLVGRSLTHGGGAPQHHRGVPGEDDHPARAPAAHHHPGPGHGGAVRARPAGVPLRSAARAPTTSC